MIEDILRENNYSVNSETRPAYHGSSGRVTVRRVEKGGFSGYARQVSGPELAHLHRIKSAQDSIPNVAPIHEIIGGVVISGEAPGELVWEMENASDFVETIQTSLIETRDALKEQSLVHADIRPWNIMFDQATSKTTLFDWGFSFFTDATPFGNLENHLRARGFNLSMGHEITAKDVENCIALFRGLKSPEEIWNHGSGEFSWRPSWCKSFLPPANTLRNDQQLLPGQEIRSPNSRFRLIYQGDGNLVVEDVSGRSPLPVWHAQTQGSSPGRFIMQGDGNAVIYTATGGTPFATRTQNHPGAWLDLDDNGMLAVKTSVGAVLWDFTRSGQLLRR